MRMTLSSYQEKLMGCWTGKNIGGTLGAPFECKRGVFDVTFFTQDLNGEPLPNDDLDLQLVWLNAVEKYGRSVNASILGEYWQSFIIPDWAEYGAGKNNMRMGIVPPLSGYVNNVYRNSCGAFIRSEIWSCLAPGHPEIAVKYAYEDAIVDHTHEGLYAEIFLAAVESAAFVESDVFQLIEIGLSYIPIDCGITRGIRTAINCYRTGKTWQEARIAVLQAVPGSFGVLGTPRDQIPEETPIGDMGWDAPSNVAITVIGLLYGEGDFGKSICIATNCGEDADCTAASIGAILGIILGVNGIPEKWRTPIGDKINTICINQVNNCLRIPKTVTDLTERIMRLVPSFLGSQWCDTLQLEGGYTIEMQEGNQLLDIPIQINAWTERSFKEHLALSPFTVAYDFVIFSAYLTYDGEPYVREGESKTIKLTIDNQLLIQQWLDIKWHCPASWKVSPSSHIGASLEQYHCNIGKTQFEFQVTPYMLESSRYDLILEISSNGRHTKGLIPIVLINNG